MEQLYCVIAECEEPTDGHGDMCSFHTKRFTRGKRGTDLRAPKAEKVSPLEKALNTVDHLYECDPNDDAEWDRRERAVKLACKVLGEEERAKVMSAAVRAGQQAARERGVSLWGVLLGVTPHPQASPGWRLGGRVRVGCSACVLCLWHGMESHRRLLSSWLSPRLSWSQSRPRPSQSVTCQRGSPLRLIPSQRPPARALVAATRLGQSLGSRARLVLPCQLIVRGYLVRGTVS